MNGVHLAVAALAGASSWTLAEYLLHRFLGHHPRTRPNPFASEHVRHHAEGSYFAPAAKKALVAAVAVPIVALLASLFVPTAAALVYGASFVAMYVAYEGVHRRAHTHAGFGRYARFLRRHHFHHHFANPRANHGVTSPLWDVVFGTFERADFVRVPRKLCLPWLVDGAGALRPEHAAHWSVVETAGDRDRPARAP